MNWIGLVLREKKSFDPIFSVLLFDHFFGLISKSNQINSDMVQFILV